MSYILNHPALLLWALPVLLPFIPKAVRAIEGRILRHLLSAGDADDQQLIRAITRAFVVWAENKCQKEGAGGEKFKQVDALLAKALPFLSADQRRTLIENTLEALDAEAKAAAQDPVAPVVMDDPHG